MHRYLMDIQPDRVAKWPTPDYRFPHWTLAWTGIGGCDLRISADGNTTEFACPARAWIVHRPGVRFADRLHRPDRRREIMYAFVDVAGDWAFGQRAYSVVLDRDDLVAEHMRAVAEAKDRGGPADDIAAYGHLLLAVALLSSARTDVGGDERKPWRIPGDNAQSGGLLAEVDLHLARSLATPPSRAKLASALRMSESSLSHRLRSECGTTLVERTRWLRIREAKLRLADPQASVKAVAASLGFSSAFWFTRVFREVTGATPQEWIRRCRR